MKKFSASVIRISDTISRMLSHVAGVAVIALVILLVGNAIVGQLASPIPGFFELVGMLGVFVAALSFAEAQVSKSHVAIAILMSRAKAGTQKVVGAIVTVFSIVLFVFVAIGLWGYAHTQMSLGASTEVLAIPEWLPIGVLWLGVVVLILALIGDLFKNFSEDANPPVQSPETA